MKNLEILFLADTNLENSLKQLMDYVSQKFDKIKISSVAAKLMREADSINHDNRLISIFLVKKDDGILYVYLRRPATLTRSQYLTVDNNDAPIGLKYVINKIMLGEKIADIDQSIAEKFSSHSIFMNIISRTIDSDDESLANDAVDLLHTMGSDCFGENYDGFLESENKIVILGRNLNCVDQLRSLHVIENSPGLLPFSVDAGDFRYTTESEFEDVFGFKLSDIEPISKAEYTKDGTSEEKGKNYAMLNFRPYSLNSVLESSDLTINAFNSISEKLFNNDNGLIDWRIFKTSVNTPMFIGSRLVYDKSNNELFFYAVDMSTTQISKVTISLNEKITINEQIIIRS